MTVSLSLFDIFLLVLGACTLSFGLFYAILRFDVWLAGRKWRPRKSTKEGVKK